mmetsp:Transcript_15935/g.34421  ORF Transcript_15935/g.34421 Transcript_15935/m.34421 type:complete len:298 (-) Transcript_15935:1078-1971(-)
MCTKTPAAAAACCGTLYTFSCRETASVCLSTVTVTPTLPFAAAVLLAASFLGVLLSFLGAASLLSLASLAGAASAAGAGVGAGAGAAASFLGVLSLAALPSSLLSFLAAGAASAFASAFTSALASASLAAGFSFLASAAGSACPFSAGASTAGLAADPLLEASPPLAAAAAALGFLRFSRYSFFLASTFSMVAGISVVSVGTSTPSIMKVFRVSREWFSFFLTSTGAAFSCFLAAAPPLAPFLTEVKKSRSSSLRLNMTMPFGISSSFFSSFAAASSVAKNLRRYVSSWSIVKISLA